MTTEGILVCGGNRGRETGLKRGAVEFQRVAIAALRSTAFGVKAIGEAAVDAKMAIAVVCKVTKLNSRFSKCDIAPLVMLEYLRAVGVTSRPSPMRRGLA
jgi:hypothetical protein